MSLEIILIAAVSDNGVIGRDNTIPWYIPEDLKRFKELTINHPVIMGRKTFQSIVARIKKPLPNRLNYVLSESGFQTEHQDVVIARNLDHALRFVRNKMPESRGIDYDKAYIIGGERVYQDALPLATGLELTEVHQQVVGDAFFPKVDFSRWNESKREDHEGYSFVTYSKKH